MYMYMCIYVYIYVYICMFVYASSAADFYPTIKAALRHETADSEEDHEGLGCHLGQGLSRAWC